MKYIVLFIIIVYLISRLFKNLKRVFRFSNTAQNNSKDMNQSISKNIVYAEFEDIN